MSLHCPHHCRPRYAQGFTLLEVLVVLLIIGVLISFATLSINRADNTVEEEAQRLAALIRLGSQEAVLQGRELAVEFDGDRYAFVSFDGKQWQPLEDDELLRTRTLPFDVIVELRMEGEQLTLTVDPEADETLDAKKAPPRIFLLSSGEMSPFTLTVRKTGAAGQAYHLTGGSRGQLQMSGPDDVS